jgi:VanZ family protein
VVRRLVRPAAWTCIVALAVLSLVPGSGIVRTGWDGDLEHVIAYAAATPIIAAAYARRLGVRRLAALLVAYAGALELGQNFSPGRHPALLDFAASAAGVIAGSVAFAAAAGLARRSIAR